MISPGTPFFPRRHPSSVDAVRKDPVDAQTLDTAAAILADVRARGFEAVVQHAIRLGDLAQGDPVIIEPPALRRALDSLPSDQRSVMERAADRISNFARAQRTSLQDLTLEVHGAQVGHTVAPVARAGCYAPGGRFPLPSSVLMTACTARAAGVREVWVASPRPHAATLAAAALAGADALLAVGGAQAIGAMASGASPVPLCDTIAGPGNRWVTAAKKLVSGAVAIDMLAGPSEVLIIADDSADPAIVAADLLAQAEHDTDAAAWLVTTCPSLVAAVEEQLQSQLASLPTAAIATQSLRNGGSVLCPSLQEAAEISNRIAPEHLEIMTADPDSAASLCTNFGAIFIGGASAEVVGDYGIGPNHTLPTAGASRFAGGLSVFNFLRIRTFIRSATPIDPAIYRDTAAFARIEGLEAHARAAEIRAAPTR